MVLFPHIGQLKLMKNFPKTSFHFPYEFGKLGVTLFFVLSGFLITYLLLAEASFQEINIKKFYLRRILRIWPLYFLIIVLAFWILPNIDFFLLPGFEKDILYKDLLWKLPLYALIFPNLASAFFGIIPYASQTWSIGSEEQFYLVWPILLKHFKKHRILLMVFVIFSYLFVSKILESNFSDFLPRKNELRLFWLSLNIDCMAIGGIYAILLFQKNKSLKILLNNGLFYSILVLALCFIFSGLKIPHIHFEFYALLFGIIILNFAANEKINVSLENKFFNYLGNISYGLYMYHIIGIVLALTIAIFININSNWLIYPLSLAFTIILAGLSYKYFETPFLKFKNRFSNIISGNETKGKLK